MYMDKRGQESAISTIVKLLLAVVVIFLVIFFVVSQWNFLSSYVKGIGEKTLKFGREPSLELNCKTKENDYELAKEDLINEIVKDMADCSYQYVNGEIDFLAGFWNYFGGSQICFVCYIDRNEIEYTLSAMELSSRFNRYLREIKQERVLLYTAHIKDDGLVISKDNPIFIVSRFTKSAYVEQFGVRQFSIIPINTEKSSKIKTDVRDLCERIQIFS